ncbi:hypothetical protein HYFRA_00006284 [Hymenoscyphus fraxineus]|uniref:Uncharacterized protein n=1 Tax=Hymenoscyphus fraxineus TaxID=746836 RepID=A0A9N9LCK7_9HELO|nr:hypothetical protein HYFRA_00006284 [Hymenoscyphus fraxineus]
MFGNRRQFRNRDNVSEFGSDDEGGPPGSMHQDMGAPHRNPQTSQYRPPPFPQDIVRRQSGYDRFPPRTGPQDIDPPPSGYDRFPPPSRHDRLPPSGYDRFPRTPNTRFGAQNQDPFATGMMASQQDYDQPEVQGNSNLRGLGVPVEVHFHNNVQGGNVGGSYTHGGEDGYGRNSHLPFGNGMSRADDIMASYPLGYNGRPVRSYNLN